MNQELISSFAAELAAIRHDLHMHPELCFEEFRTAKIVAEELNKLGFSVATGVAGTGVVGTLKKGSSRRTMGILDGLGMGHNTRAAQKDGEKTGLEQYRFPSESIEGLSDVDEREVKQIDCRPYRH